MVSNKKSDRDNEFRRMDNARAKMPQASNESKANSDRNGNAVLGRLHTKGSNADPKSSAQAFSGQTAKARKNSHKK